MSHFKLLNDKTAFITGCNRGIGKKIVEVFAENGASIIACARKKDIDFENFIEATKLKYNVNIRILYFDLNDENEIKNSLKTLIIEKLHIDILVNNAGIAHGGLLQMTSIKKIREVFEINFFSQLHIIQQISKIMMKQKIGSIINISSIAGLDSYPGYSAYGASKAALIYATKSLSQELALYNIRINSVAPSLTETDMAEQMDEKAKSRMIEAGAKKRMAKPTEIANTVLYLASELSDFVNGQVIRVDGGM